MEDKFLIDASTGVCKPEQTEECDNPVRYSNDRRVDKLGDLTEELMDGEYCKDVITGTSAKIWDEYYKSDTGRCFYDGPLMVIDPYLTEDENRSPIIPKEWKDAGKSYDYWLYTIQSRIKGIEGHVSLIRKG